MNIAQKRSISTKIKGAAVALVMVTAAYVPDGMADENKEPTKADKQAAYCSVVGEQAGLVMELRQKGTNMRSMLNLADGNSFRMLVVDAYSRPLFHTPNTRRMMVDEFTNEKIVDCYRSFK